MLKKLLKHEWIRLWKIPVFLLVILQIMALGAGLTFLEPIFFSDAEGLRVIIILVWVTFAIAVVGVAFGIYIYLAFQFYRSTYSDEGYLTHTLPVSPRQTLISKILMMAVWQLITMVGVLLACFISVLTGVFCLGAEWADLGEWITDFFYMMQHQYHYGMKEWYSLFAAIIVNGIVGTLYTAVWIVVSATIGQLVKKHRVAAAIGAACLISFVLSIFQNLIRRPFSFYHYNNIIEYIMDGIWAKTLLCVIAGILLYGVSEYLLCRKLNLE